MTFFLTRGQQRGSIIRADTLQYFGFPIDGAAAVLPPSWSDGFAFKFIKKS